MKPLFATQHEARLIASLPEGGTGMLCREVGPQPSVYVNPPPVHQERHEGCYFDAYCSERKVPENPRGMGQYWCWWTSDNRQGPDWIKCPFPIGAVLAVKEVYCEMAREHRDYRETRQAAYKAKMPMGGGDSDSERCRQEYIAAGYPYQWKSAVTMPQALVRSYIRITGLRVARVQDVTEEEAKSMGVEPQSAISTIDMPKDYFIGGYRGGLLFAQEIRSRGAWGRNAYQWLYTFEKVSKP